MHVITAKRPNSIKKRSRIKRTFFNDENKIIYSIFSELFIDDFNDVHKLKNVTIVLDDNFGVGYKHISDKLNNLILRSFDDWYADHRHVYISAQHLDYVDQRIREKVDEIIILNRTN